MGAGKVVVEVQVRPTEDEAKVMQAVLNVFEPAIVEKIDMGDHLLIRATSNSLSSLAKLHRLLRAQEILEATRAYLLKNAKGNAVTLTLHKQAAFQGKISLLTWDEESPLGPIKVLIEYSGDIKEVIDWLTPPTSRGRPLWEKGVPDP
ncbi:MAG: RNA-binding domain-containing protein [Acidilobus sp.]